MKLKIQLAFFLLLALLSLQSFSYHIEEETGSYLLDELDFHKAIQENQYLFVNFHALWCRYSKKLKPEWAILSRTLLRNNSPIKLAKLEAYDEKRIAAEFEVDQFPTLKLFMNGVPHTYYGERTEAGMLEFLDRKLKKDFTQVSDLQAITNKQKEYEWVGVLLSDYNNDAVKDVAFNMQEIFFARMELNTGRNLFNTNNGTFVLVNKVTNTNEVYDREITVDSLTAFINSKKYAPISRFCKGTAEKIFLSEEPAMILIVDKKVSISGPAEKAYLESQAKVQEITKMFMSIADFDDEITKLLVENIGLGQVDLPTVVIVRTDREKIRKYRISGVVTVESVTQFVRDYTNKKAERLYSSEMNPPTTENAKNLVKKVVGVTFNEIVLNPANDVLVLVWTPWCGHCRATFPIYDNVARKMREVDHFTVTKIDGSVNDLEKYGLDIVEYPTILFFTKKDKKNPIEFRGERNEYAFNDFIRAHATVNLEKMKGPNPWDKNEL